MIPEPITIDGRSGTVVYLDNDWHPCTPEQATMAKVVFFDGSTAFYVTEPEVVEKFDPNQLRDEKGRWAKGSGHLGTTFLHGTVQGLLDDIIANGLRGSMGGMMHPTDRRNRTLALPGHVYMTTDEREARAYARIAGVSEDDARKKGITIPKSSIQDVVYDPEGFPLYRSGTEVGGTMPVVLTIELPRSEAAKLRKDRRSDLLMAPHFGGPNPDKKKSEVARSYKGDIKPEWITSIAYLTRDIETGEETWHTINPKEWKSPEPTKPPPWELEGKPPPWEKYLEPKAAADTVTLYVPFAIQLYSTEGIGGITRKFDEVKHPRGEDGRFIEATQPRIFNRPSEIVKDVSWGETSWRWIDKETGKPSGHLLTGEPIPREQIPQKLYHVTTNAPAVESSGVLLGLLESGGLGGGQAQGVSFTSSREDAVVIQRELRRAVQIARGEVDFDVFDEWARNDELVAGLPEGALAPAVRYMRDFVEGNIHSLKGAWVSDPTGEYAEENRGKTFGHIGPLAPEEKERLRRSLMKDALNAYLQIRGHTEDASGKPIAILKNPILFGHQEQLAKLDVKNIQILETDAEDIPAEALVTTGSDKFLHEVRVYADVPRRLKKVAFDEAKHPREPGGTTEGGRFAETGRSGIPTPDPELAKQAKAGIAAAEKLLPEAVQTANYSGVPDIWEELSAATHEKVRQNFEERSYDYQSAHLDTYDLDQQVSIDIEMRERTAILDEAKKRLKAQYADVVNPETITHNPKYLDEVGETALNWGDLRRSDLADTTTPVTGLLLKDIQQSWREEYADALKKQIEKYKDSDEYLAQREKLVLERIAEQWENLEPERKIEIATEMRMHGALPGDVWENMRREPEQWVTGVETGSHDDVNYGRTHAIALKLAEMRTNEIRKERGLLEPGQRPKPIYRVVDQSVDKGPLKKQNFVAYDDATGLPIAASNTKEHAERNAEAWAIEQQNLPTVSTKQLIEDIWGAWKHDSSSGLGASLQLAAAIELGGHHRMTPDEVVSARQTAEAYGGMANLQAYVRAQWEVTQMVMEKAKQDKISVYRGLMLPGNQVKATTNLPVDKLGGKIAPPANVKTLKDKAPDGTSVREWVTFDYHGQHFQVEKGREPYKSITDVEWQAWHQVDEATKAKVLELWQADAKSVGLVKGVSEAEAKKVTDNLYTRLGDASRFDLYTSYVERGRIPKREVVKPPFEHEEVTVQRRVAEYHAIHGMVFTKLPELNLKRAGAQSTTGTREVANGWGGVGNLPEDPTRVVLRIEVPPTSILSLPVYGQNAQEEHETVIMGTNDKWLWDAWRDRAPDFASQSVAHKAETTPLEIDLQAEDRGKPHWMSDVDWAKVEAEEAKEKP